MELENKDILVERFLDGELVGNELTQFQNALETDPELKQQLELAEKTREALALFTRIQLEEKIRVIDRNLSESIFLKPVFYWWAAASLLLILGAGIVFANTRYSDNALYKTYYTPAGDNITTMGSEGGDFQKGLNAFNQGLYDTAFYYFDAVNTIDSFYPHAKFYMAMVKIEQAKYGEAIQLLNRVNNQKLQQEAAWYLALCYLRLGQNQFAHNELQKLKQTGYREKEVDELLKKLDSPLRRLVF